MNDERFISIKIKYKMTYYTHSGLFHCDEVTGFTICKLAGVCETFERLSNIENLPNDGLISDIGRKYNPDNRVFDHHQSLLLRENGYPFASAGLLWKHFGYDVVLNLIGGKETQEHSTFIREIAERVDLTLIQGIDAHDSDNDYKLSASCIGGKVRIHSLPNIVSSFNSKDVKDDEQQAIQFELASAFLQDVLKKEIQNAKGYIEGKRNFDELAIVEDDIIILPENLPWKEIVAEKYPTAKYVISPSGHPGNPFSMIAVPIEPDSREVKVPIERPDWFTGFIHQGKWIAGGDSVDVLKCLALYNLSEQPAPVVLHAHPMVEMQITNFRKDESGYLADCSLYNKDTNTIESSFFLDEQRAIEIIDLMKQFLGKCEKQ